MILKTEAIVLKKYNYRETSLIVTFFSKEFGKIRCLFKGVRKDPRKIASNLVLFSHNEVIFYKKRNSDLHLSGQCDLINDFKDIRSDFKKTSLTSYAIELIDSIMPIEDKNEDVFDLLLNCLESLSIRTDDVEKIIHFFQIKVLILSGFKPHLDSCIICNKVIQSKGSFSSRLGGLICLDCLDRDRHSHNILKGTIASILHVENSDWQRALNLGLSSRIKQELSGILFNFLSFHLDKKLKSSRFVYAE